MKFVFEQGGLERIRERCWLLTNGLGGYASASAAFSVTRCDQGLLIGAVEAPHRRVSLVHRLSEEMVLGEQREALSAQTFADGTPPEEGGRFLTRFTFDIWPEWTYELNGVRIRRRCAMLHGANAAAVLYDIDNRSANACRLRVTPLFQFCPKGEAPENKQALTWTQGSVSANGQTARHTTEEGLTGSIGEAPEEKQASASDCQKSRDIGQSNPPSARLKSYRPALPVGRGVFRSKMQFCEGKHSLAKLEKVALPLFRHAEASVLAQGSVSANGQTVYLATNGRLLATSPAWELLAYPDDEKDGRAAHGYAASCCAAEIEVPAGASASLELVFSMEPAAVSGEAMLRDMARRQRELLETAGLTDPVARQLVQSADAFLTRRDSTGGHTIVAGYPFFADWGRDTMIALPGCALATRRFEIARSILRTFLTYERDGLVPNLFPEGGSEPLYNTADAALLLIRDVWLYHERTGDDAFVREAWPVMARIIEAYRRGTCHAIGMDGDGLIHAGEGLDQVTWMDVRIGDLLPTPRHGKPVEINAYWYNALCVMRELAPIAGQPGEAYAALAERARVSFERAFWMEDKGYLRDVVSGTPADEQLRCNQIWAVSMPFTALSPERARRVVETVGHHLYTPWGLRTLSPEDPEFHPFYGGPQRERDLAYHQGTVWPFPLGAYYLAYLRVHGDSPEAVRDVRRMLEPMEAILREDCVGQLPEIYDGGQPGPSKGCFAQAWSVGELLWVYETLERLEGGHTP